MAGAGRAAVEPIDIHTLNPATLVHMRNRDLHGISGDRSWLVGIADNSLDNLIAGGLSYSSVKEGKGNSEYEHRDLRLSLAGFVSENFSMGVTLRQLESSSGVASWTQNNADLGFSYVRGPHLGFAAVFTDIMSSSLEDVEPVRLRPRTALAVHGLVNQFIGLRADVISGPENRFGKPTVLLGYESILNEFVLLRLGWGHDAFSKQELASGGFGLRLPRFRFNYAYQTGIRGGFDPRHSIDLGIPF